jgi:hypothetical protein
MEGIKDDTSAMQLTYGEFKEMEKKLVLAK